MTVDRHIEHSEVCAVGARRNNQGIPDLQRLLEDAMRMAADDDINPGHLLRERHVLRMPAVRGCPRMRETENNVDVFGFFEDLRDAFRGLDRIVEQSRRSELDVGSRVFPHQPEDPDPESVAREDDVLAEIVPVKRGFAFIAGRGRGEHGEVRCHDRRETTSPASGGVQ